MAAAIVEFGFRIPIVARSTGEVVDGHLRLKAAQYLGLETVPVVLADELTPAQVKAFRILANRSAAWAEWDETLLSDEFADLLEAGFDLALTGFSDDELADLLGDADPDDNTNPPMGGFTEEVDEDIPDAPVIPVSRRRHLAVRRSPSDLR